MLCHPDQIECETETMWTIDWQKTAVQTSPRSTKQGNEAEEQIDVGCLSQSPLMNVKLIVTATYELDRCEVLREEKDGDTRAVTQAGGHY